MVARSLRRMRDSVTLLILAGALATSIAFAATAPQRSFASPEEAVDALIQAVRLHDRAATLAVLGDVADWISSGDATADRATIDQFLTEYDAKHAIVHGDDEATLTLGQDDFPFAFPLVKSGDRWRFDSAAGKSELLARRIGGNEIAAIEVLRAIVDAEYDYAAEDRRGDGVLVYAQKFASSPGKRDGLYWPSQAGEPESPLGVLVAKAANEGYRPNDRPPTPYHGYYYRMLKGQTRNAPSGAFDYVVRGRPIAGFAVIAYPARYGNSGIMSFIVNQDGKVYQTDLGPQTAAKASQIQRFDPGEGWSAVGTK